MFSIRRTFTKANTFSKLWTARRFSSSVSLWRPVATALEVPADKIIDNLQDTHQMTRENEKRFEEYNNWANDEYDQMIQNRLDRIISSGVVSDWELAEDNGYIRKRFEFSTPDHAHWFVNEVSKHCSTNDHHPEWSMIGDKSIEVYLTSHFANNKVSIKDYELAQEMNKVAAKAKGFNPYSFFTTERKIELVLVLIVAALWVKGLRSKWVEVPHKTREVEKREVSIDIDREITEQDVQDLALSSIVSTFKY